ncbi:Pentatricopeptide repeat-containing protein [Quillaja saponaria]|uniref:Pentatricopeptide repeat-containing protein n=1 Tax=Quillaja saponaria TaxID=32244 RepID=A0AAD7LFL0_QUISA|nr:Pentatricopeptide repeat-containing protein [Quillaja saponaria]
MENLRTQTHYCKFRVAETWRFNGAKNSSIFFSKTLFTKPSTKFTTKNCISSVQPSLPVAISDNNSTKHITLLVEAYHEHKRLNTLLEKLEKKDSSPSQILREDGDWCKNHFWAVIRFLKNASRSNEILQVFDMWKNIEKSRINEFNYDKIICLLCEEAMMKDAVFTLQEMKTQGLRPSLETYNPIIHGFANDGKFDDAAFFLNEMKEINLKPDTDTYDGLLQAYGKFKMYDEIGMCVKKMELEGCSPDQITYNLLIKEYSRGGLLQKMEKVYQRMLSKRMHLKTSTLVAMLEAYAGFGIVEKMEKVYKRILNTKTPLKDDLIRQLAKVYIENYMFSRLEDLGLDLSSTYGGTDFVWCLRLLSYACILSRKGMNIIIREMQEENVLWNVTVANTIMLAYLKMKDFKHLRILLSQLPARCVKPDIVTIGILFDANRIGFDGNGTLETWRRMGYLYSEVEMKTDPLVLNAFGKGHFLKNIEEAYSSLEPEERASKTWTYHSLIAVMSRQLEGRVS